MFPLPQTHTQDYYYSRLSLAAHPVQQLHLVKGHLQQACHLLRDNLALGMGGLEGVALARCGLEQVATWVERMVTGTVDATQVPHADLRKTIDAAATLCDQSGLYWPRLVPFIYHAGGCHLTSGSWRMYIPELP